MSDETNIPGEKPKDDGGNAPQPDPEPDANAATLGTNPAFVVNPALVAEKPKDDGGGS